jgi:hypothetical protein
MKSMLLYSLVVLTCLCFTFTSAVHADFDQVGKIPAPLSMCGTPRYVMGLASDGENLFVATDCMGASYVYLISPTTGAILAASEFSKSIPGCPDDHPHLRSAAYDYDTGYYWVGDKPRDLIALDWVDDTSIQIMFSFGTSEIQMPSGMVYGGDGILFVLNKVESTLVRMGTDGTVYDVYGLPDIPNPSGLAAYGDNLFVLSRDDADVYEITKQAALIEIHSLGDAFSGCCDGDDPCLQAASFHDDFLYIGGNSDSISIFAFADSGIVIPEGDSVAVGIPGELEFTFESVIDSGLLYVNETQMEDPCPVPPGVQLYPEFYEVNTNAFFDFVVEVAVIDTVLPPTVPSERIRVFTRPSGPCGVWRDATVEYVEEIQTLRINGRTRSEDDEFSWFAIADDTRRPADVVGVKFGYLRGHIESGQDSIPPDALADIMAALDAAETAYCKGLPLVAEALLGDLEAIVRHTPAIPHTYDPGSPGTNLAGRIISRAHTLAFSLRYSNDEAVVTTAEVDPQLIRVGVPGLLISAIVEVPEGLDPFAVDAACVYMEGLAKCIPGSLSVADFDDDGDPEIRAVFRQGDVEEAFEESGPATARITCFIEGYEVRAVVDVEAVLPVVQVAVEPQLEGGIIYPVIWEGFDCESMHPYALSFSADGGLTWDIISVFIEGHSYDWLVPNISTDDGVLKVTCVDRNGVEQSIYSGILIITASAGVDGVPAGFRLALSPNPATAGLTVEFSSPRAQEVALDVYSVRGELVKTLFRGRVDRGVAQLYWQTDNQAGRRVSPGTYFVVFRGETRTLTEKIVIQR